ncbi:MAG: 2-C-methyl-D-erythritol 2,4-cyclodiphosphate synthase, partial [Actinobacteria bacterium]|nr:2-C-methyl-D-erythritol 2,4-cyclodiphosphate synthase [Actinomycetota bacterium]
DEGRALVIGGVSVPDAPGLSGHSDADVLTHAVADALLGAVGLGDIGDRFPATDEWKNASSLDLLRECHISVAAAGWKVVNVDSTVIAERPKLASYRAEMAANLAACLHVHPGVVSVKATTTDAMGFTGRGEGIAALAVVSIAAD